MKKLIAVLSLVFFVVTASGLAFAADPQENDVLSALDRNAVWTKWFDHGKRTDQGYGTEVTKKANDDNKRAEAMDKQESIKMSVRLEDRPWARVG